MLKKKTGQIFLAWACWSLIIGFPFVSCSKHRDGICVDEQLEDYKEHKLSEDELNQYQPWTDSLESQKPQLQIKEARFTPEFRYSDVWFTCQLFYKNLPVFTADNITVSFPRQKGAPLAQSQDLEALDTLYLNVIPVINLNEASEIAHEQMDWRKCYKAQLGIYNLKELPDSNVLWPFPPDYELVWKIWPQDVKKRKNSPYHYMFIYISAETGEIIWYEDGYY